MARPPLALGHHGSVTTTRENGRWVARCRVLNKWAAGISDTLALGLLNETLGLELPIIAAPCIKETLQRHPAYPRSVDLLRSTGVTVLDPELVVMTTTEDGPPTFNWPLVLPP